MILSPRGVNWLGHTWVFCVLRWRTVQVALPVVTLVGVGRV